MLEERTSIRQGTRRPAGTVTVLAESSQPPIRTEVLHFETTSVNEFFDVTEDARATVLRAGVRHGQVTVYSPHTTCAVLINESETGFLNDLRRLLRGIAPAESYYEHDDHELRTENLQEDEYINGHAHVRQSLMGASSVTIPVVEGELVLGRWQRILFAELDQPRSRRVVLHAQGV